MPTCAEPLVLAGRVPHCEPTSCRATPGTPSRGGISAGDPQSSRTGLFTKLTDALIEEIWGCRRWHAPTARRRGEGDRRARQELSPGTVEFFIQSARSAVTGHDRLPQPESAKHSLQPSCSSAHFSSTERNCARCGRRLGGDHVLVAWVNRVGGLMWTLTRRFTTWHGPPGPLS
jgi:hypothetical protein